MSRDRITSIRIEGLRVFKKVHLDLRGMNVLIGDNGTGKSTLLEAFELLRKVGAARAYADTVLADGHGPFRELVRVGSQRMTLGVVVEGDGPKLDYSFTATLSGTSCGITHEHLDVYDAPSSQKPQPVLVREPDTLQWLDPSKGTLTQASISENELAATIAGQGLVRQPAFVRLTRALQGIEYHPPFDVRPIWQQAELEMRRGPRWPSQPDPLERVRRYAHRLPAVFLLLRRDYATWERIVGRARAAVGMDLVDLLIEPSGAGELNVALKFRGSRPPLPIRSLSEGQLSFLAMLAVVELGSGRTLLALDEPDIHYHPELVVNLVQILEDLGRECPVVIATHSDRLLDALENPADSVLLCELGPDGAVALRRPNAEALGRWLERYRGIGSIGAEGYTAHVFQDGPMAGTQGTS